MQVGQAFPLSLFIFLLFDNVSESASLQTDVCSKEATSVREWYEAGCTKCNCVKNGFECYSCGSSHIFTRPACYLQDKDPHASYPLCCEKESICKGDPRFDSKFFEIQKFQEV